ncbi:MULTISPECIES: MauE/DoxX family redox-associated membrane protein [unclassified Nocardia]|uniref:MauE/DoxX family redox-associated membrane protein n=1 Tax=unclassified Nocardia TaxID=2637762 RepID=UPI0034485913
MIGPVIELVVRIGVGGLLILAGSAKAATSVSWRVEWLDSYQLLPHQVLRATAWLLPATEVVVGAMLALGAFDRGGALAAAAVLAMMTLAVTIALLRGQQVSCGCLGKVGTLISWPVVARNLVLIAAVVWTAARGMTGPAITEFAPAVQITIIGALAAALSLLAYRHRTPEPVQDPSAHPHAHAPTEPADLPFPQLNSTRQAYR